MTLCSGLIRAPLGRLSFVDVAEMIAEANGGQRQQKSRRLKWPVSAEIDAILIPYVVYAVV